MTPKLFMNELAVKKSPVAGYGVFAEKEINSGEIVEECHYIKVPNKKDKRGTELVNHYFIKDNKWKVVMLGYGSIYNHSDSPNVDYDFDEERDLAIFTARRKITVAEELFVDYGSKYWLSRKEIMEKAYLKRKLVSFWIRRVFVICGVIFGTQQLYHYYPDLLKSLF